MTTSTEQVEALSAQFDEIFDHWLILTAYRQSLQRRLARVPQQLEDIKAEALDRARWWEAERTRLETILRELPPVDVYMRKSSEEAG